MTAEDRETKHEIYASSQNFKRVTHRGGRRMLQQSFKMVASSLLLALVVASATGSSSSYLPVCDKPGGLLTMSPPTALLSSVKEAGKEVATLFVRRHSVYR